MSIAITWFALSQKTRTNWRKRWTEWNGYRNGRWKFCTVQERRCNLPGTLVVVRVKYNINPKKNKTEEEKKLANRTRQLATLLSRSLAACVWISFESNWKEEKSKLIELIIFNDGLKRTRSTQPAAAASIVCFYYYFDFVCIRLSGFTNLVFFFLSFCLFQTIV